MQETKNGLCNKPCLNGRQAQALRAILTCCESNVLFTPRHSHTNLTPAAHGNGFADFSNGYAHFSKSHLVQQGQCFTLDHGEKQLPQVRALGAHQQKWCFREQQHLPPSHRPHSLSAPTNKSKTDSRVLRWTGSVQQSKMTISAFLLCEAIMPCSTCPVLLGASSVCPPHLLRASHHTRLGNKSLLSHTQLFRQKSFTRVFSQLSGPNGLFWAA